VLGERGSSIESLARYGNGNAPSVASRHRRPKNRVCGIFFLGEASLNQRWFLATPEFGARVRVQNGRVEGAQTGTDVYSFLRTVRVHRTSGPSLTREKDMFGRSWSDASSSGGQQHRTEGLAPRAPLPPLPPLPPRPPRPPR